MQIQPKADGVKAWAYGDHRIVGFPVWPSLGHLLPPLHMVEDLVEGSHWKAGLCGLWVSLGGPRLFCPPLEMVEEDPL